MVPLLKNPCNFFTLIIPLFENNDQEGAGHQVVSAFVEIVFDNSDNRIPVSLLLVELELIIHNQGSAVDTSSAISLFLAAYFVGLDIII